MRRRCQWPPNSMSFYVTTPIYYVNGEPHLGHAYSTIAADILARHHRQRGEDVFFLTGTDEHGEPVAQQAEAEGITPRELGDRLAPRFKEMAAKINASNDFFIRTTDEGHMERVQEIVQRVYDNGHVYEGVYEGWYCPRCADFKTESEIGPDNTCPIHQIPLTREKQDNWFFKLSVVPGRPRAALRRASRFRHPRLPAQRGALLHQAGTAGRLAVTADAEVGGAGALGHRPGDLRLVRRPAQLLHGARLRRSRART